ncbi:SPW repeat domain-containing protein [Litoribacter populi]|uniref:SPW repeat domain-containing protein n=1 Tax=Litoribacter populi TaxID=2598460 RepID=UPI00117F8AE8|nr:SPW repeat protein [Litoribacter populi]
MKIISTRLHGYIDYLMGILLIASPWLFGFYNGNTESWIPITIGVVTIVMSLMTAYEVGVAKIIPFKVHLSADFTAGLLLASSPWLFGFAEEVYLPHLLFGVFEILTVLMTKTPSSKKGNPQVAY